MYGCSAAHFDWLQRLRGMTLLLVVILGLALLQVFGLLDYMIVFQKPLINTCLEPEAYILKHAVQWCS